MRASPSLGTQDLVDLALLGLTSGRPQPLATLVGSVKRVSGGGLTPTADFVEARALGLLDKGFVACCLPDEKVGATASGRAEVIRRLRLELDPDATRLRWICASLTLCFLELVDAETRREIAQAICNAAACCPENRAATPPSCPPMTRCLAIERKRREHEARRYEDILLEDGILDPIS